jgi:hypothetical protein
VCRDSQVTHATHWGQFHPNTLQFLVHFAIANNL